MCSFMSYFMNSFMDSFPSAFLICSFVFPIFIHQLCIKILNLFCLKILENSQVTPSITVAVMFTFSFGSAFAGTFEAVPNRWRDS